MSVQIQELGPSISKAHLHDFESRYDLVLPDDYRLFLLKSNGGRPLPDAFEVPGWVGISSAVDWFLGLREEPYADIGNALDEFGTRLPREFLPIANDPSANTICLGVSGPERNHVYYWANAHDFIRDEEGNMFWLADSFTEFLEKLHDYPHG
jgi:hypothetical protein